METSLMVNDYPSPPEEEEKTINTKICISFDVEFEVPKNWSDEMIEDFIKDNYKDYDWENEIIEIIEVN